MVMPRVEELLGRRRPRVSANAEKGLGTALAALWAQGHRGCQEESWVQWVSS